MCSCVGPAADAGLLAGSQFASLLDHEHICAIVARHAPVLPLHHNDAFMPCSVEWMLDHCELWLQPPGGPGADRRLLAQGDVTGIGLQRAQKEHPCGRLQLRLNPAARCGPPVELLDDAPLYANVKLVVTANGAPEALEINYLTLYAHNGSYDIGYLGLVKVGAHDGDWEHVTMRACPTTGDLQGVWFNAHRSRDGCWLPGDRVERTATGRLIAYVARHGHGTYPRAGVWGRAAFFANDLTSSHGPLWRPKSVYLLSLPGSAATLPLEAAAAAAQELPSGDAGAAAEAAAADAPQAAVMSRLVTRPAGGRLPLLQVPSRGSRLPPAPGGAAAAAPSDAPEVLEHSCEWLDFLGEWGTIPAPAAQGWFWTAEPPVSRGALLRVFAQGWPETLRI